MFSKLNSVKTKPISSISIDEFISLVKNNPSKSRIEYLRSIEYKSKEYNTIKTKLPCITPHGVFSGLNNKDLIKYSNYLYYDIDGLDTIDELNDTIRRLIDLNIVYFICKSVGGRGISFLIKLDDTFHILNDTQFTDVYNYVRSILISNGFKIDESANGLVRKLIISSDSSYYLNDKVSLSIEKESFQIWLNNNQVKNLKKIKRVGEVEENGYTILNDTFLNVIPLDVLYKDINIETQYGKEIDGDFIIDEMNYYRIVIPKIIKDGTKHKLYTRIVNALYYINNNITIQQVYSYLYYINEMAYPKMNEFRFKTLIYNLCKRIEETGEIRIKPRVKRLHFSKNSTLTRKEKKSMGGKLGAKIKNNKTLDLIEEARMRCSELNIIPTQKKIMEMTGLSIATIKRNWNKQKTDLNSIDFLSKKEIDSLF